MREIKFRAWYGDKIGMLEPIFYGNINKKIKESKIIYMQYTGLKDCEGNEIYEGDILKDFVANKKYKVIWDSYGMFIFTEFSSTSGGYDYYDFEEKVNINCTLVIGNIYENKELLEEK